FGVEGFPGEKRIENEMWGLAERLFPRDEDDAGISAYTQGLMDLGATLCGRGKPECRRCPYAADCVANVTGRQRELPAARPKKAVPTRRTWMLVLRDGDAVLLERRPPSGIWGGLWSLPEADGDAAALQRVREFGGETVSALAPFVHTFTHFRLEIEPRIAEVGAQSAAAEADTEWVPLARLDAYGVPAPVRKLLDALSGPLI
ncbi:NUDIX domain-containing protein, partial [Burkholderia sp. 3C]